MKKWGQLLVRATQGYPQGEGNIPKVSIRLDNTTATKSWMQMQQPQQIEHAGAKEMRILGWAERVACTNELQVHTAYCPGELNLFRDLVSRIAAMMGEAASARKAARSEGKSESESTKGAEWTSPTHRPAVWTVGINHQEEMTCHHSILNDFGGSVSEEGLSEGYVARRLRLSKEDGKEINRAMMNDETGIQSWSQS